jgi:CRISPR-associated autoregulator DevR family
MKIWSISISYRLGLGFHALNNEGSDGSNLMQPRRIDVGNTTYDGISGEIIRHHILENFVNICRSQNPPIQMLPLSEGLHPDRGPIGIRAAARNGNANAVILNSSNLFQSVRSAIKKCAVLDVGGFLAAWKDAQGGANAGDYVAEGDYINRECAAIGDVDPVKRDSCFDVAWLISESPQDLTITQHSAFRATASMNSRYAQTMRSNIYGGVIRADLHRIGTDDYWYLQNGQQRPAITNIEQQRRQKALIEALINFIASPTGAKTAGWAPHVFLNEGAILLTSARTAPFVSPIKVVLNDKDAPIQANSSYIQTIKSFANDKLDEKDNPNADTWVWPFSSAQQLIDCSSKIIVILNGMKDAEEKA